MAGSRLPPLPRGGGGSGAALAAREQRENSNNDGAAAASLSQEPFSQMMVAAGDNDVMGLGFSCTGFDASGAPVALGARGEDGGGGARAASTHVVADWDANAGGASRRRGKVREPFFPPLFRRPSVVATILFPLSPFLTLSLSTAAPSTAPTDANAANTTIATRSSTTPSTATST